MLQLPKGLMRYQRGYDEAHKEIVINNPLHKEIVINNPPHKGFNQSQFYAKKSTKSHQSNQLELQRNQQKVINWSWFAYEF